MSILAWYLIWFVFGVLPAATFDWWRNKRKGDDRPFGLVVLILLCGGSTIWANDVGWLL